MILEQFKFKNSTALGFKEEAIEKIDKGVSIIVLVSNKDRYTIKKIVNGFVTFSIMAVDKKDAQRILKNIGKR